MLAKLLKYDLKYMIKNMSVFYILAIFFAIVSRILNLFDNTVMIAILSGISSGCMYSMMASILINTMLRSWIRFSDSIYKDEAYLTHTLPVTKNDIYNSKFIQTLIFFIIGFLVILLSIFVAFYTPEWWESVKELLLQVTTGLNFNMTLFVIGMLLVIFLEVFNAIQCGFLGIILGHKKNNKKTGFSVLYGFIFYLVSQVLIVILIFTVGLFTSGVMDLFKTNAQISPDSFKLLIVLAIIFYLFITWIISMICKEKLRDGVNIE